MSLARDVVDRLFFPNRDVHAIPVLDAGLAPNRRLEEAEPVVRFNSPDCIAQSNDGRLYVSAGASVFVCEGERWQTRKLLASFEGTAGALVMSAEGLLVCVNGQGVRILGENGEVSASLSEVDGIPLRCPTAVAVANDGTILITDGSRHNDSDLWLQDLMQNLAPSGRVIACGPRFDTPRVLASGLSWPGGIVMAHDEKRILVTEAWAHRLSAISRTEGQVRCLVSNFPGYPGRITRGSDRHYWLAFFALRTQLTEFVLREHTFRRQMMERVPPELWIGPSLGGRFDYREPTQIGRIKKLGIQKPWAPPRSYGLMARLDDAGYVLESLHSRTSGEVHGVTSAIERDGELLVVSKGHGKIVAAPLRTGISQC